MRIRDWGSDVCASDLIQQPSHGIITESLAKDFPQSEAIARADTTQAVFVENGEPTYVDIWLADADLFKILQLPFLRGNPETALDSAANLILSRKEEVRRFGGIDVVGRTINTIRAGRSEERRVGKECVSMCRSRGAPVP